MKQFILNCEPDKNGRVRLEGGDYHYLVRVRRLAVGEFFPARLSGGGEVLVRIISIDGGKLVGKALPAAEPVIPPEGVTVPPVILFQALPKGEKMDLIVRQAAEGGAAEIVPFESEFSTAKKNSGGQKFSRWQRIIKEARQQSGSVTATEIRPPETTEGVLEYWETIKAGQSDVLGLFFHHVPLAHDSLHRYLGKNPSAVVIAVGPEGGFSPDEARRFLVAGFKSFTIGGTILRTETAVLYAQAAVRILLLERESWETK